MARYICQGVSRDQTGKVILSATVAVVLTGTTTAARIYAASTGGTAVNSVTSSATTGYFSFYVDEGDYTQTQRFDLVFSKTGYTSVTYTAVVIFPARQNVTNVLDYGAVGDGTTDDTAAIQAAITAGSKVYFPPGIYAISDSITLKDCLEVVGPEGGTFTYSNEHPVAGTGAALKWIGAASGTMVYSLNKRDIRWHGVDLDGVDVADTVIGFHFDQDNAVTGITTRIHMSDFRGFNLGTGLKIASDATDYNSDTFLVERFEFYKINIGIHTVSQNHAASIFGPGFISPYQKGVWLQGSGFCTLRSIIYGAIEDMPSGGGFVVIGTASNVLIEQMQGEGTAAEGTGWRDIYWTDEAITTPTVIRSSVINRGWLTAGAASLRRIISIGNYFETVDQNAIQLTGTKELISIGDTFNTGELIVETGTNNLITKIGTYVTGGDANLYPYIFSFNGAAVYKTKYDGATVSTASSTCTLTANAATTTVSDTRVTASSQIYLFPTSATAAADVGSATSVYISAKVAATSFTITHPNNANADKTFNYVIYN